MRRREREKNKKVVDRERGRRRKREGGRGGKRSRDGEKIVGVYREYLPTTSRHSPSPGQ